MAKSTFDGFKVEIAVSKSADDDAGDEPDSLEAQEPDTFARSGEFQIAKSTGERREIVGIAMVANEIDAHGDMFTPEAVEFAAHNFLARYNVTKDIGRDHSGERPEVDLIGSWYTEEGGTFDGLVAPPFSWVAKMKILDDRTWADVKAGKLTGLSIEGPAWQGAAPSTVAKSVDGEASEAPSDEAGEPKRLFVRADPNKLDLVDHGANLRVMVWKAIQPRNSEDMNQETEQTPAVETEAPATEVAKAEEKPADIVEPAPATEVVEVAKAEESEPVEKAKAMTPKRAEQLREAATKLLAIADEFGVLDGEAPAEPVAKSADVDVASVVAEAVAVAVAKALAPIAEAQAELTKQVGELAGTARSAPSAASDDDGGEDPVEIAKRREARPFSGTMDGFRFGGLSK